MYFICVTSTYTFITGQNTRDNFTLRASSQKMELSTSYNLISGILNDVFKILIMDVTYNYLLEH